MRRRVVVTGLGPVSSIGIGKKEFWENASRGRGYFRNVDFEDVDLDQYKSRVCSPIDDFNPVDMFEDARKLKRTGKATQYTVAGTFHALTDAGFTLRFSGRREKDDPPMFITEGVDPSRCGVILGQSMSNTDILIPNHRKFIEHNGPKRVNPLNLPQSNCNVGASTVAEWFYLKGTNLTIATACSSATHAIGMAALNIIQGMEEVMVTGGAEATLGSYFFSGFDIINALSRRNDDPMQASRPFDRDRDGFVLGEGAGILILEELEHAQKRDARIYGELVGFGFSADAYNIVAPDPYGRASVAAIKRALAMSRVSTTEIEYINAHGTSTVLNDPNESFIIKSVFGDRAFRIPISSSKSMFGHTIGAAGGLESIVTLLTMTHGIITPTINHEHPDLDYVDKAAPELDKRCDLDYVPHTARKQNVDIAMTQSFGFGGQNGVIVFKKVNA
jgi:3-oxoacyl-[acyl-carrier-protein] synthase II